jgi:hypothetical protein
MRNKYKSGESTPEIILIGKDFFRGPAEITVITEKQW